MKRMKPGLILFLIADFAIAIGIAVVLLQR
jgi:hypothetical protein